MSNNPCSDEIKEKSVCSQFSSDKFFHAKFNLFILVKNNWSLFFINLYNKIKSVEISLINDCLIPRSKNTEPPPTKGSKYLFITEGLFSLIIFNSFALPPGYLINVFIKDSLYFDKIRC